MHARALFAFALTAFLSQAACVQPTSEEEEGDSSQSALAEGTEEEGAGEPPITRAELDAAERRVAGFEEVPSLTAAQKAEILARYASVPHAGIRNALYEKAILYYDHNLTRIPNKRWLAVLDFSKHSKNRRYYLMDMQGGPLVSYVVAHGKNSDTNDDGFANSFSNVDGSNKSSVGFYLTAETYFGANGRSLKLDGLSTTNSNVRARYVVIHGADYVADGRAKQGRSLGCPAFSHAIVQGLIDKIAEGSLLYAMN